MTQALVNGKNLRNGHKKNSNIVLYNRKYWEGYWRQEAQDVK